MKKALGIDIGGTKIYAAYVNEAGEIVSDIEKHSTPKSSEEIIEKLKEIIAQHESEVEFSAISTAGGVNKENTKVICSTANLPFGYPKTDFSALSNKPVFVENDANCAAWAEYKIGSAKGMDNNITLTLGTGVGGGIIIDGKLLKGKSGVAGEMHFKMSMDKKRQCSCGAFDCYEIYASGNGLRITGIELTGNKDITTYDIIEGVNKGDATMLRAYNIWQNYIIAGLVGLADIFDPDCIVLSGSMGKFCDVEYMQEMVNDEIVTLPTKILHATSGNYAGMIGAVLLGFEKFNQVCNM